MPTQICADCGIKVPAPTLKRCRACYEGAVTKKGELALHVECAGTDHEKYELEGKDVVYATFYRLEKDGEIYFIKTDERKWCMRIEYYRGFPCAPRLSFVSPYNHKDGCPTWWPKTKFFIDPVRKVLDLLYVDERTALKSGVSRGRLDLLRPKTETQYAAMKISKTRSYRDYLDEFWKKKSTLENGDDAEAHAIHRKWTPDYFVGVVATQILPPTV